LSGEPGPACETSLSLLDRARRQTDDESWNRLVGVYQPLLKSWLARYQVQSSDADDLVQEVLTVVFRELPAFEHNRRPGAFRSWLRTILVNRLRDFWRGRQYRPVTSDDAAIQRQLDELADENSELSGLWNRQHDELVMQRIIELVQPQFSEATWSAFSRQVMDGVGASDVAGELDMSIDSVYAAKSRVLRMLRQEARGLIE
jgi:RNA polymerase sigma-70 factor (ECF subfamily)